ncbi:ribosome maturation factor RimM [Desulfogranum marinum]|uniref:ribosome maturation factor RimM n=1 Tax=Desulfogranum marinum TaxID=453220 RepID=UPI00196496D3|nr:ribosome maturation factor RimM [Desulfogranum marinum]MBM9510804.1 16S rRNA processing protein RimM [Desulfogranum marinum]
MNNTGGQTGSFVLLGKIVKAHGIRGEVKIYAFTETAANLYDYTRFYLSADDGKTHTVYTAKKMRAQGGVAITAFEGCVNRNQAEILVGQGVWVDADDLPELDDGEFYLHSLQGKQAMTVEGQNIGKIVAVITGRGQDLLSIQDDGKEYLIPFVADFVVENKDDEIIFSLPPGLLEING